MRSKLMLILTASVAVMLSHPSTQTIRAQGQAALTGTVSSDAEGKMEGVVVTATKPGSIVEVSVTTDAQGRYTFPESRLDPGEYAMGIRAVGYDIDSPAKATVAPEATTTADIKLKTAKNLASQLTNAEWMMSIPGTEEQKAELLNCVGCHTLERIARSTHDFRRVDAGRRAHDGLWRREPADQAATDAGSGSRGHAGAIPQVCRLPRHHQSELNRPLAIRAQDAAAPERPGYSRHRHRVRHGAADD